MHFHFVLFLQYSAQHHMVLVIVISTKSRSWCRGCTYRFFQKFASTYKPLKRLSSKQRCSIRRQTPCRFNSIVWSDFCLDEWFACVRWHSIPCANIHMLDVRPPSSLFLNFFFLLFFNCNFRTDGSRIARFARRLSLRWTVFRLQSSGRAHIAGWQWDWAPGRVQLSLPSNGVATPASQPTSHWNDIFSVWLCGSFEKCIIYIRNHPFVYPAINLSRLQLKLNWKSRFASHSSSSLPVDDPPPFLLAFKGV